ncbi:ferritin-like protein [Streptomyces sp. SP17BM10]|uniref:ferritin-like domain-containing protein n=1 Tax=Streptomyces sp. SP17BM10 TaxID=3002530 RepID=UPI002E75EC43|nr:ferritin-like protein [Streptomyces sp. SP17BM10]MEE1784828.1 ferritin-like protein [Streptomyces sp. SP17BM10]
MTTVLDYRSDAIVHLMRVPAQECDEQWLKDALQRAIILELATIPPYAAALWSVKDGQEEVAKAIREIIFDEMSHFGLVCNMLTSIGGTPKVTGAATVPQYPGPLPGGVRPELEVYLSGLSRESAFLFSEIEKPDHPIAHAETYTSIGAFYARIAEVFPTYAHLLTGQRQIEFKMAAQHGAGNDIEPMTTIDDVLQAIAIIKAQGEGTDASPENPFPGKPDELAHYYRFREIYHGRKLVKVSDSDHPKWDFQGDPIPLPDRDPAARVPAGGWANDPANRPTAQTAAKLQTFNGHYSTMLRKLEEAWQTGSTTPLFSAIGSMGSMRNAAREILAIPLPDGTGATYCPEYLYTDQA